MFRKGTADRFSCKHDIGIPDKSAMGKRNDSLTSGALFSYSNKLQAFKEDLGHPRLSCNPTASCKSQCGIPTTIQSQLTCAKMLLLNPERMVESVFLGVMSILFGIDQWIGYLCDRVPSRDLVLILLLVFESV